jgi:hypothetical protein
MKRIALAAAFLLSVISAPAIADNDQYDFDLIHRPAGVTDAQVNAGVQDATRACDPAQRQSYGSRQFLGCMRRHGYKFVRIEHQKSAPADPYFSSDAKLRHGHFIDHDTGMDCQSNGFADICMPPNGTVRYFDPDQGLPCTRTGLMSVCSNM